MKAFHTKPPSQNRFFIALLSPNALTCKDFSIFHTSTQKSTVFINRFITATAPANKLKKQN
jgi:hypothetical protein